ncbi:MAG: CDP-2,3-bis-(O-geranylgeranyl)-sn-glycerol synthase [Thermoprotei archaeon]|nr:MAG: CDP-2,3-bis-(O-geranylgeranyl)-sn-glycerol synthase [Thermoprotei archaeon]
MIRVLSCVNQAHSIYSAVVNSILAFLPALIANGSPVVVIGKLIRKTTPMDFNHKFVDGRPILGRSKTWEGFIVGTICGSIAGAAYGIMLSNILWIVYGLLMGLGAMVGDALNSFIKRRLNIPPGKPFIPMDQLSFVLVAYALVKVAGIDSLVGYNVGLTELAIIIYVVLVLHPLTNLIAYKLGLKDKPW